jgi:hypothetical protein
MVPSNGVPLYERTKQRYYRWIRMGVLDKVFDAVAAEPDLEWVMLDATVIRAHALIVTTA